MEHESTTFQYENLALTVGSAKTESEDLLSVEELTGISFRCWRCNDGLFQMEAYVGNTQVFFFEDGRDRFGSVHGKDQETVERDMSRRVKGGVLASKSWKDDPDTWNIPSFSTAEELRMKASLIGGNDPFKAR